MSQRTGNLEQKRIGTALIAVQDDEFVNGYQAGYLFYMAVSKRGSLSDLQVHAYILYAMNDQRHTVRWNAGRVAGWFGAMHEKPTPYLIAQVHETTIDGVCLQFVEGL